MVVNGEWRVLYEHAFDRWVSDFGPPRAARLSVLEWVEQCTLFGPPGAPGDPDKECSTEIAPHGVAASFYALPYERLIIVRRFG
jgi:hypothetical protein